MQINIKYIMCTIADLFIALSAEVVCCPARLHRWNLKHIKQNTSNAQGKDDPDK